MKEEIVDNLLSLSYELLVNRNSDNFIIIHYNDEECKLPIGPATAKELFVMAYFLPNDFMYYFNRIVDDLAPVLVRIIEACEFDGKRSEFINHVLSKIKSDNVLHNVQSPTSGKECSE